MKSRIFCANNFHIDKLTGPGLTVIKDTDSEGKNHLCCLVLRIFKVRSIGKRIQGDSPGRGVFCWTI